MYPSILKLLDYLSNKQHILLTYVYINFHYPILIVPKRTTLDRQVNYTEDNKKLLLPLKIPNFPVMITISSKFIFISILFGLLDPFGWVSTDQTPNNLSVRGKSLQCIHWTHIPVEISVAFLKVH